MDEYGFFIYWKSEGSEGEVKELSQVNDIRGGEMPKVNYQIRNLELTIDDDFSKRIREYKQP